MKCYYPEKICAYRDGNYCNYSKKLEKEMRNTTNSAFIVGPCRKRKKEVKNHE